MITPLILQVYVERQPLTGAPVYKDELTKSPIRFGDFGSYDFIFRKMDDEKDKLFTVIKNNFGPVGVFTEGQMEEFLCSVTSNDWVYAETIIKSSKIE